MTIKRRLQNYYTQSKEVEQLHDRILELKDRMTSIRSSSDMSEIPGGSGNSDKIGAAIARLSDLEGLYIHRLTLLTIEQENIENMIEPLEPIERLLLRARYIEGDTWEEVCLIIGYGWAQTHRIHSEVLKKLSQ